MKITFNFNEQHALFHTFTLFYSWKADRSTDTIQNFFNMVSLVGSRVVSDTHPGYNFLGPFGWQHGVVIHRYHFVDPLTGWTTNDIERVWRFMKQYFKPFQPIQPQFFSDFLYDFSFRYNLRIKGNNDRQITDAIINAIIS